MTNIGKFLRDLRIEKQELLYDMARKMGIGSADLSAIEAGKRPLTLIELGKVINKYNLNKNHESKLRQLFLEQ